jgi:type IV pilus assembly protein PilB
MEKKRLLIGNLLISKGLVTQEEVEKALEEQKKGHKPLGHILLEQGVISERDLILVLSEQLEYPYIDLEHELLLKANIVSLIPFELSVKYNVIAISQEETDINVAMADPMDINAIDAIQEATGYTVVPFFSELGQIKEKLLFFAQNAGITDEQIVADEYEIQGEGFGPVIEQDDDEFHVARSSTIVKTVDNVIKKAVEIRASDIHLDSEEDKVVCRMRVDGALIEFGSFPKDQQSALVSRIKIMSGVDIAEKRLPQDGRINKIVDEHDIDLRVATYNDLWRKCDYA